MRSRVVKVKLAVGWCGKAAAEVIVFDLDAGTGVAAGRAKSVEFIKAALEFANGLRDRVNGFAFPAEEGLDLHITASYHAASMPSDARDAIKLLALADTATYRAKESSRDGIASA
jgi:GGDEF domain-containing protein